jgi:hypothetical protein
MSDETDLAEAVGRLTEENRALTVELAGLRWKHSVAKAKALGIALPLATAVASLIGYPLWKVITTSSKVDHCYICPISSSWSSTSSYRLRGSVDWQEDSNLGDFRSIEEAKAQAAKLDCKMGPME